MNLQESFEIFWEAYPRKIAKGEARRVWQTKVKPDEGLLRVILAAVETCKQSEQWQTPKYIPHARTWLSQQRWEDEPDPPAPNIQEPWPGSGLSLEAQLAWQQAYPLPTEAELEARG